MTRLLVLSMLLLVPLGAGCLGGGDEAVAPAATGTDDGGAAPSASAETADAAEPAEPVFSPRTIDWSGSTPTGYCAPAGPNGCVGMMVTPGDDTMDVELTEIAEGTLTLTWDALPTQEFVFSARSYESCGDRCISTTDAYSAFVQGTSPLTLTVRAPRITPPPVYGWAEVEQPFRVQGELMVRD